MASCNLCNSFGSTKIEYNYDLARAHAKTHLLQVKIIEDGIDINQVFEQCFPDFAPVNVGTAAGNSGRRDLLALCRSLFARKSPRHLVICEKCGDDVKAFDRRMHLNSNVLIEHASKHLELKAYECLHCTDVFISRTGVSTHLAAKHQLDTSIGHFRSKEDAFVEELSSMIKVCFEWKKITAHSKRVSIKSACASSVRSRTKGSHLAVERQVFCYRLIRKVADRDGNVRCRVCSKGITATDGTSVQCERVRDHAYRHSPTPLFRCRLCSDAYFGRNSLTAHLQSAHTLPALKQNYECLADQYHSELLAIMNKCYDSESDSTEEVAVRNVSESNKFKRTSRSQSAVRRLSLCHQLIRKRANAEGLVECRLCSKQINAKMGNTFSGIAVMQHASLHLGKTLYQCKKCSEGFRSVFAVRCHLKSKHSLPSSQTNYQCLADQFHGEIEIILRQCYGDEVETVEVNTRYSFKRDSRQGASAFPSDLTMERQSLCARLTRECSDDEQKRIQCRLCNKWIAIKKTSIVHSDRSLQHALVHLEKPIYRCKICSETSSTRGNFSNHVRTKHALPMANNYECSGDQFHSEIMETLRKCYNKEPASEFIQTFKSRISAEASIRRNGSKQSVERQLFCYRLIRKFTNSERKIKCRMCKKQIVAKCGENYKSAPVMIHALAHLRKPIYRCVVCSEKCPDYNSINRHVRKAHALRSLNNYECLADEYHLEILAKLGECYGEL